MTGRVGAVRVSAAAVLVFALPAWVWAGTFRIVTYNIEADTGGYTTARPGMTTVLQGLGNVTLSGSARPIDILTLQETTSNTTTVAPLVSSINTMYGGSPVYDYSHYQATVDGSTGSGNGPNALIYNTTTLQLIASVGVGTPSTSGAPRQPVRYQFRPVGGSSANDFYVYCSHMKSGTQSSDMNRRNIEAQLLRSDETTLPAGSRVIYTGDFNLTSSTEAAYVTMLASGNGQGFDPLNRPGNWDSNSAFQDILTESATSLRYRDDFELVTQNILNDPNGMVWVTGTYMTFGVNGSTPVGGSVNSPSNTALPGLPNRSNVLSALTTASDHLPVVADYTTTISQSPVIGGQPANASVCTGDPASFTVSASGPGLSYQWREGTTNLSNGGNIAGATTATLSINPAGLGDAATNYNCVVTNSFGSATSNNASLTVTDLPVITGDPQDETVTNGDPASFTVTPQGAPGNYTYQWRRNGVNLQDSGARSGTHTQTISISATIGTDAGNYDCVVIAAGTTCDTTSAVAVLTVNLPPCPADLDRNGQVDLSDVSILLSHYGSLSASAAQGDLDGNATVDLSDLSILLSDYGQPCP